MFRITLSALILLGTLTASHAEEAPAPSVVSPTRSNPQATMTTFLEAVKEAKEGQPERIKDAVATLDLSKIDSLARKELGPRLAWTLLDILDRTWLVNVQEISNDPNGATFQKSLIVQGRHYGDIVISRQSSGEWLFDSDTVSRLDRIWKDVERLPFLAFRTGSGAQNPGLWVQSHMPSYLTRTGFLLEHWQWLGLLILIVLGFLVASAVRLCVGMIVRNRVGRKQTDLEGSEVEKAERPIGLLANAATWGIGLHWLNLPNQVHAALSIAATFFGAVAGVWTLYRLVDVFAASLAQRSRRTDHKMDEMLAQLVRKTLKVFVLVMGVVFVAENLGIEVKTMIAGLGIGGLAVALAAKDTVENLFGSITVLIDRPFKMGDFVRINEVEGNVEELGFRSTRIRTAESSLVTVPNSKLVGAFIHNYSARTSRRIRFTIALKPANPPERIEAFCSGIRGLVTENSSTTPAACMVHLNEIAPTQLKVLVSYFVQAKDEAEEVRERERVSLGSLRLARDTGVELC